MRHYRRLVLGVVAWVAVVTLGATLVWTVISKAGAGVAGELPPTSVTSTVTTGGQGTSGPASATTSGSPTASGSQSQSPPASTPVEPSSDPVRRSWHGAAGVVVAECRAGAIGLVGAQPASGWSVEVDHAGPDDLRVEFESGEAHVQVEATCVGGTPSFAVEGDRD